MADVLGSLKRARVAVVGLGVSNMALVRFLAAHDIRVTACDQKEDLGEREDLLRSLGATLYLGPDYLEGIAEAEVIFLTPGMPRHLPEIVRAVERGARLMGEMGLFLSLCPATVVGITGSAGKTTTTSLTGDIFRAAGRTTHVGGNIGTPLIGRLEEIGPDDVVVLEMSSFQLALVDRSPHVGAVLNISPNHLDVHVDMDDYVRCKENIFRFQGPGDWTVLSYDDPVVREMKTPARPLYFSLRERADAHLSGGYITLDGERVLRREELPLEGDHNVANAMAAFLIARALGVPREAMARAARAFRAPEHRLERVAEIDGVLYYNDSIATAPDRTIAALRTMARPVILIAGGYDKKIPFAELGAEIGRMYASGRLRGVVLLGDTREKIQRAVEEAGAGAAVATAGSFEEAVRLAAEMASPGDAVLLSPACASYDMFANFVERGRAFKELVGSLEGKR